MPYIQGYVLPVPAANKEAYRAYCENFLPFFKEAGGSRIVEAWGDDIPDGKITDFKRAASLKPNESVVFSWMEFSDKKMRDAVFAKMRSDPRIIEAIASDIYEHPRMIHGGFVIISERGARGNTGYIEGSLMPVPSANRKEYRAWADSSNALFVKHGATRAVVAMGDDLPAEFAGMVQATSEERIAYCWIEWPSKEIRATAWKAVMEDPDMRALTMPFDGTRMIFGGFLPILDA